MSAPDVEKELKALLVQLNPKKTPSIHASSVAAEEPGRPRVDVRQQLSSLPPPVDAVYRRRLINFYEQYNIYKLPTVSNTIRQYKGHETALFAALVQQYGPEPELQVDPDDESDPRNQLPQGWFQVESTRGDIYYRHVDGRRQWHRPTAASNGSDGLDL